MPAMSSNLRQLPLAQSLLLQLNIQPSRGLIAAKVFNVKVATKVAIGIDKLALCVDVIIAVLCCRCLLVSFQFF